MSANAKQLHEMAGPKTGDLGDSTELPLETPECMWVAHTGGQGEGTDGRTVASLGLAGLGQVGLSWLCAMVQ